MTGAGADAASPALPVALAVDGGGSKTDVVAVGLDGAVLAHARGRGTNAQTIGWPAALATLDALRHEVLARIRGRAIAATHVYLAGLDLPAELDTARTMLAGWAAEGCAPDVLDNDLFALLRAGTLSPDAIAVVCGTGINALGVRADGATARFPALGDISGDWGGGAYLGAQALWHAARAVDGRGPASLLAELVPAALGFASVPEVTEALHFGRLEHRAVNLLTPALFTAADGGDAVARGVVDRQVEEIAIMVRSCLARLGLLDAPVPVVLGGGVFAARPALLVDGVAARLAGFAPRAEPVVVAAPPILGAGLSALDALGAAPQARDAYRAAITAFDFAPALPAAVPSRA